MCSTVTRKGYVDECPNVGKLLKNLKFTLPMENEMMGAILNDGENEADATKAEWIKLRNPEVLDAWLEGVTTTSGEPGLAGGQEIARSLIKPGKPGFPGFPFR